MNRSKDRSTQNHHHDKHGFDVASDKDDELLLCIGCGEYHIALDMKYDDLCVKCYLKDLEDEKEEMIAEEGEVKFCYGCENFHPVVDMADDTLCETCYGTLMED